MPEYRRIKITGSAYSFTVVTLNRQPLLTSDEARRALREGIQRVRQSLPFIIEAWVLLPDHLHTIWTLPEGDANYQARWAIIKRAVTRLLGLTTGDGMAVTASRRRRQEGSVWQRRFWEHLIRDDKDFQRHLDYLHFNPVKHGYVINVADWPYSTFHSLVKRGLYSPTWGGNGFEDFNGEDFGA